MAPWRVPAGLRTSGVTGISTTPAIASSTAMPASSLRGRDRLCDPLNMLGIPSGDACGFGASVCRRGTVAKPIAPVATGSRPSVTRSTVAVADRRPLRRIVVRVESDGGARIGRIRTDMSEVNIQASGSSSRTTPAATSIMKAMTLARTAPW